jgi:hypothetical protein
LREKIRDDLNNYADDLANGACQSFEEYRKLCGVIQGLAIAERYIIDLAKKMDEAND